MFGRRKTTNHALSLLAIMLLSRPSHPIQQVPLLPRPREVASFGCGMQTPFRNCIASIRMPRSPCTLSPLHQREVSWGGDDGQVRLWSNGLVCQQLVPTQDELGCADIPQRFPAHTAPVRAIAWSGNGRFLATGGEDGILAIWRVAQGLSLLTTARHTDPVLVISWAPDHYRLAVASGKTVTIWTLQA